MKVKEVNRTANMAWSPARHYPIMVAAGTAAQQLDATFSTSAQLEIFSLNLAEDGFDMPVVKSLELKQRLHSLLWTAHGMGGDSFPSGLLVGGADGGIITLWNADRIIKGSPEVVVNETISHTGPVRCLDINPFQPNLLVSGASESEIYIWDLSNPGTPMSPGNRTQPPEDIVSVSWNRQVEHIVASACPSGRCVVWDLRKNQPVITVSDTSSRIRCRDIQWHPDVPTQMVLASEDDRAPIIQLWDLRFAASPVKVFEKHEKGILSIAWCPQDSDLLLSAGKDNHVFCFNPNSAEYGGEVVYEVPSTSQWCFDVQWCPRNPGLISTSSFDGHISVYSLLGGTGGEGDNKEAPRAAVDPNDPFGSIGVQPVQRSTEPLKKPPKWLRRPCAANFGFGGKLVSFGGSNQKVVTISQVTTEMEFMERSSTLEGALREGRFAEFCAGKMDIADSEQERNVWNFLKVTFESDPRQQFLSLLGYNQEELKQRLAEFVGPSPLSSVSAGGLDLSSLSQKMNKLSSSDRRIDDGDVDLLGDLPSPSDPFSNVTEELNICTGDDVDGQLTKSLLVGNFQAAVEICLKADRMADALVLAVAGGSDLFNMTQKVFFERNKTESAKLMSAVVNRSWAEIARAANLSNWKEVLAALVTFAGPEDFANLCDVLGGRMEREEGGVYSDSACLCYICSGNLDRFIDCWRQSADDAASPMALQDLVEKVVLLKKAVERKRKHHAGTTHPYFEEKLCCYADLLASQGNLYSAFNYLKMTKGSASNLLKHRLYHAQGGGASLGQAPPVPFEQVGVSRAAQQGSTESAPRGGSSHSRGVGGSSGQYMHQGDPVGSQHRFAGTTSTGGSSFSYPLPPTSTGIPPHQPTVPTSVPNPYHNTTMSSQHQPVSIFQPAPVDSSAPPTGYTGPQVMAPEVHSAYFATQPHPAVPTPPQSRKNESMSYMYRKDTTWNDPPILSTTTKPPSPKRNVPTSMHAPVSSAAGEVLYGGAAVMVPSSQGPDSPPAVTTPITPPAPEPPVEKTPIPQEYTAMVATFDGLKEQIRSAASSPALKRKLEDVTRKLEALYDLLREKRLSAGVIMGLGLIAQDIQTRNYHAGIEKYNQMVTTGSFSEIGSFIPGVKVLLQLALQLNI